MSKDLVEITHHQTFESLREEKDGGEFWSARKLAKALEYNDYRNFLNVIDKAKEACINSQQDIEDHFVDVTDMIEIGLGKIRQSPGVANSISRRKDQFSLSLYESRAEDYILNENKKSRYEMA